jgi:hypothetical protein
MQAHSTTVIKVVRTSYELTIHTTQQHMPERHNTHFGMAESEKFA